MVSNSSLVATSTTTRTAYTGISLADGLQGLHQSVRGGSWVDGILAGGSLVGDAAATVIDPFSALLANGLGWVMEHFEPLREVLDKLTGIPDKVTAHAQTWANMAAGALQTMADDLRSSLAADLPDWGGGAAESYGSMMTNNVDGLGGLAVLADTMSAATRAAGNLVQFTRDIVRDLICDLVARVIVWAAEALAIITIPVVTAQIISAVAKWCGRIFGYTGALISSLQNLTALMEGRSLQGDGAVTICPDLDSLLTKAQAFQCRRPCCAPFAPDGSRMSEVCHGLRALAEGGRTLTSPFHEVRRVSRAIAPRPIRWLQSWNIQEMSE